jgi:hypothetical protein
VRTRLIARKPAVGIERHAVAYLAADQLVDRHAQCLALDIPERQIDGADGADGDRAAGPGHAAMQRCPVLLDLKGILAPKVGPKFSISAARAASLYWRLPSPMPVMPASVWMRTKSQLLARLGMGLHAQDFNIGDLHSTWNCDGLSRFRINSLGAFSFGQADEYVLSQAKVTAICIDAERRAQLTASLSLAERLQLEAMAEPIDQQAYQLDKAKRLATVESGQQLDSLTDFLRHRRQGDLPLPILDWLYRECCCERAPFLVPDGVGR